MSTRRISTCLLLATALLALPAATAHADTTIVGCSGNATTDGGTLLTAYSTAASSASATTPQVVVLSACLYDLGTSTLDLESFTDLVGYDRNTSIVVAQIDYGTTPNTGTVTVDAGVDAEIANVTIRNDEEQCYGIRNASDLLVLDSVIVEATCEQDAVALYTVGSVRANDSVFRAEADGEEVVGSAAAIEDVGGDSVVSDSLLTASGPVCSDGYGILASGSDLVADDVSAFIACTDATAFAITGSNSSPRINNSKGFAVAGGSGEAVGVDVSGSGHNVQVSDTRLEASLGGDAYGVRNGSDDSSLRLFDVSAFASLAGGDNIGAEIEDGLLNSDRSTLSGSDNAFVVATGATGRFGVSQLIGARGTAGSTTCVGSYDGAYAAIASTTC